MCFNVYTERIHNRKSVFVFDICCENDALSYPERESKNLYISLSRVHLLGFYCLSV